MCAGMEFCDLLKFTQGNPFQLCMSVSFSDCHKVQDMAHQQRNGLLCLLVEAYSCFCLFFFTLLVIFKMTILAPFFVKSAALESGREAVSKHRHTD